MLRAQNSTAHHSAYFEKRALEATIGAAFAEIPRFCKLIIVRVSFVLAS